MATSTERSRKYRALNPDVPREEWLWSQYHLTIADYDALHDAQGGVCAICEQPETIMRKGVVLRLAIDHCHVTGQIRGLLCGFCNSGLGRFRDNSETLQRAAKYLRRAA